MKKSTKRERLVWLGWLLVGIGAAALAGLSCGMWSSFDELSALRRSDRIFTPQRVQAECDDAYRMWKRAVQRAGDWIEH